MQEPSWGFDKGLKKGFLQVAVPKIKPKTLNPNLRGDPRNWVPLFCRASGRLTPYSVVVSSCCIETLTGTLHSST